MPLRVDDTDTTGGIGGNNDIGAAEGVFEYPRMQSRACNARSEKPQGLAQTINIIVEDFYNCTKPNSRLGRGYGRHISADYHHLAWHNTGNAAKEYTLAMHGIGKQRRSNGNSCTTIDFLQYVGKGETTGFVGE